MNEEYINTLEEEIQEQRYEIERLEKENERYCIAINEMAINISKAIEYIEKHIVATETENILLEILKGEDNE